MRLAWFMTICFGSLVFFFPLILLPLVLLTLAGLYLGILGEGAKGLVVIVWLWRFIECVLSACLSGWLARALVCVCVCVSLSV